MKLVKIFLGLSLLFCLVISAAAQDMSDYGNPLEIIIPTDSETLYNKYKESGSMEDYNEWMRIQMLETATFPQAWSPDGKWIVFSATTQHLWIIPSEGGIPELLFDESHEESGYFYALMCLAGLSFTPDSQELTFSIKHYDEEKGSIIDVNGSSTSFKNPIRTIRNINIYTGEVCDITDGEYPTWSHDGRYLCYLNFDYRQYFDELEAENNRGLTILDTETGEKWFLTDGTDIVYAARFTPDDSSVIFSMNTGGNTAQFFKVPVIGGEYEQITFGCNDGKGTGNCRKEFDISPDGEWIVYSDLDYFNFFTYESSSYGTSGPSQQLCFLNIATGDTYKLFPDPQETNMYGTMGQYSPDGTQIMYMLRDYNTRETKNPYVYIKDIDPDMLQKIVLNAEIVLVEEKPESFVLLKNYPNPFNPTTTIEFNLPEAGFAELSVYNITGQKIRELVSSDLSAGVHSAVWDGCDQQGNPVSSGVFISRLITNNTVVSNRMLLVK